MSDKRWHKGMPSPNPGGIPKNYVRERRGFERRLRECVESMQADDPMPDPDAEVVLGADGQPLPAPKIPAFEAIVKETVLAALKGDRYARDCLLDRLMGKPKQTVAVTDDTDPQAEVNWAAVPIEKRRELFETLALIAPGDGADATEH